MKKLTILATLVLGMALGADAQTRTLEQMTDIAARAMQQMQKLPVYGTGTPQKQQLTVSMNTPELAVFNSSTGGWVMVSADPRTNGSVLAYSREGSFNWASAPENAKDVINGYINQIQALGDTYQADPADVTDGPGTPVVDALIKTKWDQLWPYNLLCPTKTITDDGVTTEKTCVTCCVATSMAQILYYWKSDNKGQAVHTNFFNPDQTVDFSKASYDWDSMLLTYDKSNCTEEQANAVAKLMYDCGAAANVEYGISVSSALGEGIPAALMSCFDFSTDVQIVTSDTFQGNWDEMLRMEFDAHRPVIYNGVGNMGGHSFICDGYDDHGYFHFNFGWSGEFDAYYRTSAVSPTEKYQFNDTQQIVTGIHPAAENDRCTWQDGMCFRKIAPGMAELLTYTDNLNTKKLVTPEYVEIDGDRCLTVLSTDMNYANSFLTEAVLNGVHEIRDEAFYLCSNLKKVYIDQHISNIGSCVFGECDCLETIKCMAQVPPAADQKAFDMVNARDITLIVPKGCRNAYREASVWKKFGIILEDAAGDTVNLAANNLEFYYFDDMDEAAFRAYNKEYMIRLGYVPGESPAGRYGTSDLASGSRVISQTDPLLEAYIDSADFTVSLAADSIHYAVAGTVRTVDGRTFILDLTYVKREKSRSLNISFSGGKVKNSWESYMAYGYSEDNNYYLSLQYPSDSINGTYSDISGVLSLSNFAEHTENGIVDHYADSGSFTATVDGMTVTYTGTILFLTETDPDDNPQLTFTMTAEIATPYDPYKYDEADADFEYSFTSEDQLVFDPYSKSLFYVDAESDDHYLGLLFYYVSKEDSLINEGVYDISHGHESGTVVASTGVRESDYYIMYSYAGTIDSEGYIDRLWFLNSGTVTVSVVDGRNVITVDAVNTKGRTIKATINNDIVPTAAIPVRTDFPAMTYDLNGRPVTDGYRKGIVITEGKKYLR